MQTKVDIMKIELICYYFDKCFMGKVDEDVFNYTKHRLFLMLIIENTESAKSVARDVANSVYKIQDKAIRQIKSYKRFFEMSYFEQLPLIKKLYLKHKCKVNQKVYANTINFSGAFFETFGISLASVYDEMLEQEQGKQTISV